MTLEQKANGWQRSRWRIVLWIMPVVILLIPAVAMQFTDEVKWGLESFVFMGGMLFAACGAVDLAARTTHDVAYRAGVGVGVVTAFLLIWVNLAAGIIGSEDNPANLMYVGVVAIAAIGAAIAGFQPEGMARSMWITAIMQAVVAVVALALGDTPAFVLTCFFVAPWLAAARLFQIAAKRKVMMVSLPAG